MARQHNRNRVCCARRTNGSRRAGVAKPGSEPTIRQRFAEPDVSERPLRLLPKVGVRQVERQCEYAQLSGEVRFELSSLLGERCVIRRAVRADACALLGDNLGKVVFSESNMPKPLPRFHKQ